MTDTLSNGGKRTRRRKLDFYPTPPEATVALIEFLEGAAILSKRDIIWECACGSGSMTKVFKDYGYKIISSDIKKYNKDYLKIDFLKSKESLGDWIITNPPFDISADFIKYALNFSPKGVAFLFKSQYWHAKKRISLFNDRLPHYILPLTWRPDFRGGELGGNPTMEVLWTVWLPNEVKGGETHYIPLPKPKI